MRTVGQKGRRGLMLGRMRTNKTSLDLASGFSWIDATKLNCSNARHPESGFDGNVSPHTAPVDYVSFSFFALLSNLASWKGPQFLDASFRVQLSFVFFFE